MNESRQIVREFSPILASDIVEGLTDFHVHIDLPGVHTDDLDVIVSNGQLRIKAERKCVHREDSLFRHKIERAYGKVCRSVPIPLGAIEDSADATFRNGVLTVKFAKTGSTSMKLLIK